MHTDVIVPVWNLLEITRKFIESLREQEKYTLIVIDNGSEKKTQTYLETEADILIRNEDNLGYVTAINQGIQASSAESILLANNDIILPKNTLTQLRKGLEIYDVVAPLSNNISNKENPLLVDFSPDQEINEFTQKLRERNKGISTAVDYVYGHCMMIKREVTEIVGSLDERYGMGNYDDVDFCKRVKSAGFSIGVLKDSFVYHRCHSTFKAQKINIDSLIEENKKKFEEKWQEDS